MLRFIQEQQPLGSQLILGLVDTAGIEFGGTTIEFKNKYAVLSKDQYGCVMNEMRPLIHASLAT